MKSLFQKLAHLTAIALFSAHFAAVSAAEPKIEFSYIPPLNLKGIAEGQIVWDGLTADNAGQYAVVAMLHAVWPGGGDFYVKPFADKYLNEVDANGFFSILLTTGGTDENVDRVIFYLVKRAGIRTADVRNPTAMSGKYLATRTISRRSWVNPPPPLTSSVRPGFVAAGTEITLSCVEGGVIRYTLDGSNPVTSSTAQTYNRQVFQVPVSGSLLVRAAVKTADTYSKIFSLLWLPAEPLTTPFWGLNVSLALNGEPFGHRLTEATTRERMLPVARLTKWVRTFGTINNGHEYINKIAKELGLRTMIGVSVSNDASNNKAQIEGLRKILQMGPAPDLIAVGNETSLAGVSTATLASCIDEVREMVLQQGLAIPVGSVDIAHTAWNQTVSQKLDFTGVNIYDGTWNTIPENQMLDAMKQTFANSISASPSKLVLLTETGTPYSGGRYSFAGGSQTASKEKAAKFLCGFLKWIKQEQIPAFYFEAYDEPVKSQSGGHIIEQYFGIMDGKMQIHSFYRECIP